MLSIVCPSSLLCAHVWHTRACVNEHGYIDFLKENLHPAVLRLGLGGPFLWHSSPTLSPQWLHRSHLPSLAGACGLLSVFIPEHMLLSWLLPFLISSALRACLSSGLPPASSA